MDELRKYLNSLVPEAQIAFALRCETTVGYLRKAISKRERLREKLCIAIDRESAGRVTCDVLRSDVDWAYLRRAVDQGDSAPAPLVGEGTHA